MSALRKTIPSRLLFDPNQATRLPYVPALETPYVGVLARWHWDRSADNPANYPETGDEIQASAIAEHNSMEIPR